MGEHARLTGETWEVQTGRGFLEASWVKTLTAGRHSLTSSSPARILGLLLPPAPQPLDFPFSPSVPTTALTLV